MDDLEAFRKLTLPDKVCQLAQSKHYMAVTTLLAQLVYIAAKPHGADVERLISFSNILKTSERPRSSMHLDTENLFLFIHYNMPPLVEWDPRPAVMTWLIGLINVIIKGPHELKERSRVILMEFFQRPENGGHKILKIVNQ